MDACDTHTWSRVFITKALNIPPVALIAVQCVPIRCKWFINCYKSLKIFFYKTHTYMVHKYVSYFPSKNSQLLEHRHCIELILQNSLNFFARVFALTSVRFIRLLNHHVHFYCAAVSKMLCRHVAWKGIFKILTRVLGNAVKRSFCNCGNGKMSTCGLAGCDCCLSSPF